MNQIHLFFILIAFFIAVVLYARWLTRSTQNKIDSRGRGTVSSGSGDGSVAAITASVTTNTSCGGSSSFDGGGSSDSGC